MYKQNKDILTNTISSIQRIADNSSIPLDPDNTDYQKFKKDLANNVPCNDATGTAMTQEQITAFLETLK